MPVIDKRIDAYIEKAKPFAKPILHHIRKLVHSACPDVEEKIKWGMPFFDYKGPFCNMASFKEHCAFGFWKAKLMNDFGGLLQVEERGAMGNFDRITSVKDLPSDKVMKMYMHEAMRLNEEGVKVVKARTVKKQLDTPPELAAALKKNKKAMIAFEAFPPSHRNEYIQWITEAKTEATKTKRIETTVEWVAEGKGRNWKYETK